MTAPNSSDKLIAQGKLAVQQGNIARALAIFSTVIENDPYRAEAFLLRGAAYLRDRKVKRALADLNKAVKLGGESFIAAYQQRALVHKAMGNVEAYQADIRHAMRRKADYASKRGDIEGALAIYEQWAQADPEAVEIYHGRALLHFQMEQYAAALDDYNQILRITPKDAEAYSNRSALQMVMEKPALALIDINRAIQIKPDAVAYRHRANILMMMDDKEKALSDAEQAVKLAPRAPESYRLRADVLHALGKDGDALRDIRHYEALGGEADLIANLRNTLQRHLRAQVSEENAQKVEIFMQDAEALLEQDQFRKAQKAIENALKIATRYAPLHTLYGDCLRFQEDYEGAHKAYNRALALDSDAVDAYYGRALTFLNRKKRDPQAAIADLDEALVRDERVVFYRVRGMAYGYSANPDDRWQAVDDLQTYLTLGGGIQYGDAYQVNKLMTELRDSLK
jgi:tetratricopeptide (TPR) repeat protein